MEDLRCHTIHTYFKVLDSDMYGGEGSEGFMELKAGQCAPVPDLAQELAYTVEQRKNTAKLLNVSVDKIIWISRDEYRENVAEDEEEEEEIEDEY